MSKGSIYNGRRDIPLIWLPDGKRRSNLLYRREQILRDYGLVLGESTRYRLDGVRVEAFVCKKCKKCIFDTEQ